MTSGILHAELPAPTTEPASSPKTDPQFDHAIRPWVSVGIAIVMTLVLVALFMYGQIAPGA